MQQYFTKRRALAHSIFTTGFSVGYFALPSLVRIIISEYGWSRALIVISGIILQSLVFGLLMRPVTNIPINYEENNSKSSKLTKKSSGLSLCSHIYFIIFLISVFGVHIGQCVIITYLPLRCDMIDLSKTEAANLLTIIGITGIFFRPAMGYLADRPWINRVTMYGMAAISTGALTGFSTLVYSFPGLIVTSSLFSLFSGEWHLLCTYTVNAWVTEVSLGSTRTARNQCVSTYHWW